MQVNAVVNGVEVEADVEPRMLLVDFLRDELGLTGTHIGCEDGKCGACTIRVAGEPTKACMLLAVQAEGVAIQTVESLAAGATLNRVQEAFRNEHALQCGYCTPGFLMAAHALLERTPNPTEAEIRLGLCGNVCRCTGYTNIVKAVAAAVNDSEQATR